MITKTEKKHTKDTQNIWVKSGRLFFLLCLTNAVGYIGSVFITPKALEWYHSLILSELTPPGFLFGLVWTVLYFLMAFSAFLVWNRTSPRPFVLQLAFNLIWPFVFFYLKEPIAGLAVILMMMYFIIMVRKYKNQHFYNCGSRVYWTSSSSIWETQGTPVNKNI